MQMGVLDEALGGPADLGYPAPRCLPPHNTINLARGCCSECRYCYMRSLSSLPGPRRVTFLANALDLVEKALPRLRGSGQPVLFSSACEPFMPHPRILAALYEAMALLLDNGVSIVTSTKARVPRNFIRLFAHHPGRVRVQMGLTTHDDRIRRLLEPNTTAVGERLSTLRALTEHGVAAEVRIDPLIPELTDGDESVEALCEAISREGVRRASASYLFVWRGNFKRMAVEFEGWSFREMAGRLYTHKIENYFGEGAIRVPTPEYRRNKYDLFREISERHGVCLDLCHCKNPDVVTGRRCLGGSVEE